MNKKKDTLQLTPRHYHCLKDIIEGLGDEFLINQLIEAKIDRCRQWQHADDYTEKMEQKARKLEHIARSCLEEVRSISRMETALCLLTTLESTYSKADDEFSWDQQLFLFKKCELSLFRRILPFETTQAWSACTPIPPFKNLEDLTYDEVFSLSSYELTPRPISYDFSTTFPELLNAELIGHNAVFSPSYLAVDFLEKIIDLKLHKRNRICQYITNQCIADEMKLVGFKTRGQHDLVRYLRNNVLFNRIHLYNAVKSAINQNG